jgi:hypothetical protein
MQDTIMQIEKNLIKVSWEYRHRIFLIALSVLVLFSLPLIPYINLYINKDFSIFAVTASVLVIFNVPFKKIILIIMSIFVLALLLQLIGEVERAELLGNYIYVVLFIGVVSEILRSK